jgi:WD40 repeat protein
MYKWIVILPIFWITMTATAQNAPLEWGSWSVAWNASGTRLAVAEPNGNISIYDLEGILINNFSAHDKRVHALDWNPVNDVLASAGWDGFLRLWEVETGNLINEINLWGSAVRLAWHPDGHFLATATSDTLSIWDTSSYQLITSAGASVLDIDWRSDGSDFAAAPIGGVVIAKMSDEGFDVSRFRIENSLVRMRAESVAWNHDETQLVTTGSLYENNDPRYSLNNTAVRIWDAETTQQIKVLYAVEGEAFTDALFIGEISQYVVAITQQGSIYTFDVETGEILSRRQENAFLWMLAWNEQHNLLTIGGTITDITLRNDDLSATGFLDTQPFIAPSED